MSIDWWSCLLNSQEQTRQRIIHDIRITYRNVSRDLPRQRPLFLDKSAFSFILLQISLREDTNDQRKNHFGLPPTFFIKLLYSRSGFRLEKYISKRCLELELPPLPNITVEDDASSGGKRRPSEEPEGARPKRPKLK